MGTTAVTGTTCTKCEQNPKANGHQWCKSCKAAYQKEYTETQKEMIAARAFCEGAEAMRHLLVTAFLKHSIGMMYGSEVARYIGVLAPPRYGDQPTPAPGPQPLPNKTAPDVAAESR
jgi:hypothetical protein